MKYNKNLIYDDATYGKRKIISLKLYNFFVNNQNLEFNEFMTSLKDYFENEIDVETIKNYIKFMKRNISSTKGIEMYNIWCNIVNNYRNQKTLKLENNN